MPPTNPQNQMVRITNKGKETFLGKYAGAKYQVQPGQDLFIPWDAMCLWFGHPEAIDLDKKRRYRTDELNRLRVKYGVYEKHEDWEKKTPKIEVYTITGERIITIIEDPEGKNITPDTQTRTERETMANAMASMQQQIAILMKRLEETDKASAAEIASTGDTRTDQAEVRPELKERLDLPITPDPDNDIETDVEPDRPARPKVGNRS